MTTSSVFSTLRLLTSIGLSVASLTLTGCDSPAESVREIKRNLEKFQKEPSLQTKEALGKSFVKIEGQIKALEAKEDTVSADLYRRQALTLLYEFHSTLIALSKWHEEQEAQREAARQSAPSTNQP
jgi:hypothetical protein